MLKTSQVNRRRHAEGDTLAKDIKILGNYRLFLKFCLRSRPFAILNSHLEYQSVVTILRGIRTIYVHRSSLENELIDFYICIKSPVNSAFSYCRIRWYISRVLDSMRWNRRVQSADAREKSQPLI